MRLRKAPTNTTRGVAAALAATALIAVSCGGADTTATPSQPAAETPATVAPYDHRSRRPGASLRHPSSRNRRRVLPR